MKYDGVRYVDPENVSWLVKDEIFYALLNLRDTGHKGIVIDNLYLDESPVYIENCDNAYISYCAFTGFGGGTALRIDATSDDCSAHL